MLYNLSRRLFRRASVLALLGVVISVVAWPVSEPVVAQSTGFSSVFGVESVAHTDDITAKVDTVANANVSWVRLNSIRWDYVQPNSANEWLWDNVPTGSAFPGISANTMAGRAQAFVKEGITPVVVIRGTPNWALKSGSQSECGAIASQQYDNFANFVGQVVDKYNKWKDAAGVIQPGIKYWEIGNEPDAPNGIPPENTPYYGCWGNTSDPYYGGREYGEMLKKVYAKVKSVDPDAKVIFGGLLSGCQTADGIDCTNPSQQPMLKFLEGALVAGAANSFDMLPYHAYANWSDEKKDWDRNTKDWTNTGGGLLGKLYYFRGLLGKYGVPNKPIIMNEGALLWCPNEKEGDLCYGKKAPDAYLYSQANFVARLYTRGWAHGLKGVAWYHLEGPGWRSVGLLDESTPRKSYYSLQFLAGQMKGMIFSGGTFVAGQSGGTFEDYRFCTSSTEARIAWTNDTSTKTLSLGSDVTAIYKMTDGTWQSQSVSSSITVGFEPFLIKRNVSSCTAWTPTGTYWNFNANDQTPWLGNGDSLTSVPRYANGPCAARPVGTTCTFDTRTFTTIGTQLVESITAYGRYWNFNVSDGSAWPGNGNELTTVTRYANGPCAYRPAGTACTFDTRTFTTVNNRSVESVTAYNRIFNWFVDDGSAWSSNGNDLTTVSRYANGPCRDKAPGTCTFGTRTFVRLNDQDIESITQ